MKTALLHTERSKALGVASIADSSRRIAENSSSSSTAEMVDKQGFNIAGAIDDQSVAIRQGFANLLEHLEADAEAVDKDSLVLRNVIIGWAQEYGRQLYRDGKDYDGNPRVAEERN